jgi:hypothetical protein
MRSVLPGKESVDAADRAVDIGARNIEMRHPALLRGAGDHHAVGREIRREGWRDFIRHANKNHVRLRRLYIELLMTGEPCGEPCGILVILGKPRNVVVERVASRSRKISCFAASPR